MSENTSSIATSRPTRSTRGNAAASSSSKVTVAAATKPRGAPAKKNGAGTTRGRGKGKEQVYCVCRGKDYGTPMICCGACREWYHFSCLGLEQEDAEDIEVYICGSCSLETGLRTARDWEGPEGLEEVDEETLTTRAEELKSTRTYDPVPKPAQVPPPPESESEDEDPSSDEYLAEGKDNTERVTTKRRIRRMESSEEDDSDDEEDGQPRTKRSRLSRGSRLSRARSTESPAPGQSVSSMLKRKQSVTEGNPPAKKSKTSGPDDDPTRKYCLGKLREIFSNIFLTFPYFPPQDPLEVEDEDVDSSEPNAMRSVPTEGFAKTTAELTDEEKVQLEERAGAYATRVEAAVFEAHAEFDRAGNPTASGKYRERFRMLDFNLKKPDRATLHKRIVSFIIPPVALAHMSSTDLASEAERESIKQAEQEALEHSILQKVSAPRAKVTHKGLQDIEHIDGRPVVRDVDLDKEIEDEERRARERTARMRMRSGTLTSGSGSLPPESPVVPDHSSSVGWGGPPPVPFHLQQSPTSPSATDRPPLFAQSQSELLTPANGQVEGELNLADLINIDDDVHDSAMAVDTSPTSAGTGIHPENGPESSITGAPQSPVVPQSTRPTGISPFAVNTSQPDLAIRPSFDLNSVWSAPAPSPKKQEDSEEVIRGPEEIGEPTEPPADLSKGLELKDPFVDDEIIGGVAPDDKDFDMFLEGDPDVDSLEGRSASANPAPDVPVKEPSFDELPQVWLGSLSMPLESSTPTEIPVLARQMGGRPLEHDSPLWRTLFPSVQLRIDGRVPIDKSAQFLLQMRMNSSKELIAVALSPPSGQQKEPFKSLIEYLLGKNRHGLVFPWGTKPKDYHPGRELYIVPLLSSEPLPDYVELLDSLRLPKTRTEDYLIGVWILNKGKLAAPPAPAPPTAQLPNLSTSTPGLASIISQLQQTAPNPTFGAPPLPPIPPPSIPGVPSIAPPPTAGSPINPAVLAAEVASLTPDQIQRMLQSITQTGSGPSQPPIPQQSPPPIPPLSDGHGQPPWVNGPPLPGPPGVYPPYPPNPGQHQPPGPGPSPPPLHPHQQPPYHQPGPPPSHRQPSYPGGPGGHYENHDQFDGSSYDRNRYERGYGPPPRGGRGRSESGSWRGRGGGRDRDKGRDRDRDRGDRQRDSGWPKRGGRGGGPGWGERSRT